MSLKNPYPVNCPSCGQGFEAVLWDSVNTSVSPEALELLGKGEFNVVRCPGCGEEFFVLKPALFHFPRTQVMIYAVPDGEDHDRYYEHFGELDESLGPFRELIAGYSYRVLSWTEFLEALPGLLFMEEHADEYGEMIERALSRWPETLVRDKGTNGADVIEGVKGIWLRVQDEDLGIDDELFVEDEELYWKTLGLSQSLNPSES